LEVDFEGGGFSGLRVSLSVDDGLSKIPEPNRRSVDFPGLPSITLRKPAYRNPIAKVQGRLREKLYMDASSTRQREIIVTNAMTHGLLMKYSVSHDDPRYRQR